MLQFLLELSLVVLAYFMGSIPCGLLVAKYAGIGDIRKQGSGNIGATNVLRNGGKKLGAITLGCDALKGFIPVLLAKLYGSDWAASMAALAAVSGHIFPIWLNFKGGKGVATTFAVLLALSWPLFIFAALVWSGVFYVSRISSLSAIIMLICVPVVTVFFCKISVAFVTFILAFIVIYKHKENIIRLLRGQEVPFGKKSNSSLN